ncbi:AI-2E family transporter [Pararhodobacter sp.]|uniref:AI-2E family transporter n=1 Tax=Pararhodobacter sp. TaxID=2127056 RepID=UPI002AFF10A5|nr:AI-2E family transporter [Pararhodobacter sp.]
MTEFLRNRWPETVLAVLALAWALKVAEAVMAPLVLAFVTALVLTPVMNVQRRIGIRPSIAATITLLLALAFIAGIALTLQPWVVEIVDAWPRVSRELRSAMLDVRYSLSGLIDAQREVIEAIAPEAADGAAGAEGAAAALPSLADAAWMAPALGAQILIFLGGLFFFLMGKDRVYDWAQIAGFRPGDFRRAEARVASYFGAVTLINVALATAVGLALAAYGLPGAPVWGVVAGMANFVIYLGPAVTAAMLLLAGTVAFDGVAAVAPMLIYLGINLMEAQFVTPMVIGQRMRLDPLLVFLSLTLWLWLWGPIGGIVAIPLVLWVQSLWNDAMAHARQEPHRLLV